MYFLKGKKNVTVPNKCFLQNFSVVTPIHWSAWSFVPERFQISESHTPGQLYCHRLGQKTCQNTTTYQWTGWSSWWCYGILYRSKRIKKNATFCSPIGITSLMQPNCSWISRGELEYLRKPLGCNHTNRINGLHHFIHLLFVYNQNWFSWAFFYLNGSM